jgi:hypothetical protein
VWAVAGAALLGTIPVPGGVAKQPLPKFDVVSVDGATVNSSSLVRDDKWLLVYVLPYCRRCDAVLQELKKEQVSPAVADRITVIVGGVKSPELKALCKDYPNLAQGKWFADPKSDLLKVLQLQAAPAVLGVRKDSMEWRLIGILDNLDNLRSVLKTWREEQ